MQNNITIWSGIIQIISSIVIAIFTICLWWATKEHKNIAKQEKDLTLFKLRMEHYHKFIEIWTLYSSYFVEYQDYCDTCLNYKTVDDRTKDFQKINHELTTLNSETRFLFNEDIYNIENNLLKYFSSIIFSEAYDKDLANDYTNNKKYYKSIVENTFPILNVGVRNAK